MNCKEYAPNFVKCIAELQNTFNEHFHEFRLQEQNTIFFRRSLSADAAHVPAELQRELID